jgi:hypothetical protein
MPIIRDRWENDGMKKREHGKICPVWAMARWLYQLPGKKEKDKEKKNSEKG